jgi:ribosomal protein S18 acetylase RimI-like enzyme
VCPDRPAPAASEAAREGGWGFIQLTVTRVTIRSATDRDIAAVLSLWQACGTTPGVSDTREGLAGLLALAPDALLLAEVQATMIGSLIVGWDGWRGSFYRLAVRPEQRRRGVATALLREGERRLKDLGAARMTAIVASDEPGALAFWEASGYGRQADRVRFIRHT